MRGVPLSQVERLEPRVLLSAGLAEQPPLSVAQNDPDAEIHELSVAPPALAGALPAARRVLASWQNDPTGWKFASTGPRAGTLGPEPVVLQDSGASAEIAEASSPYTFLELFNPIGLSTTAPTGNLLVNHTDSVNFSSAIRRFSPAGVFQGGAFIDTSVTAAPNYLTRLSSGGHLGLMPGDVLHAFHNGNLLAYRPSNDGTGLLLNLSLVPIDTSSIYDAAAGITHNFGGSIQPHTANYGDLAVFETDTHADIFMAGISNGLNFVLRLKVTASTITSAKVLIASTHTAPGQGVPRGVAVNQDGNVLTTLPVSLGVAEQGVDRPVVFGTSFDLGGGGLPVVYLGNDLPSRGITVDGQQNFIIATGPVGSTVINGSGGYVVINRALTTIGGFVAQSGAVIYTRDVALSPGNDLVYMSIASPVFTGVHEVWRMPYTPPPSDPDPDPGEIRGVVWNDVDGNGERDGGEQGLPGWTVFLDENQNGVLDAGELSELTDVDGAYRFEDLLPGTYHVRALPQPGWGQTYPVHPEVAPPQNAGDRHELARRLAASLTTTGDPEELLYLQFQPGEGLYLPETAQSGPLINIDQFRGDPRFEEIDGSGFSVAVLDTGINLDHPFFGPDTTGDGIADRIVFSYDFYNDRSDATDHDGHGSNVSSIVGSSDPVYTGMAPGADLIHLKVFPDDGSPTSFAVIEQALQWVVANAATYNIVAVNLSLGAGNFQSPQTSHALRDEFAALNALGVISVAAAGNDFYPLGSVPGVGVPAADPDVLAVSSVWDADVGGPVNWGSGATDFTTGPDRIVSHSQRHETMTDIFAPGAFITGASHIGSGTLTQGGTSQASPHIAGIAALAQQLAFSQLGRLLTPEEFRTLLRESSAIINDGDDENDNVVNTGLDFPRVDVFALGEAIWNRAALPAMHTIVVGSGEVVTGVDFGMMGIPDDLGVVDAEFHYLSAPHELRMTFDGNVSNSLTLAHFTIENLTDETVVAESELDLSFDGLGNTAVVTFPGYPNGIVPMGVYQATLGADGLMDDQGRGLVEDFVFSFHFLPGDANGDGKVDVSDLSVLAANWQKTGVGWTAGDFNYDGLVNVADLSMLAANWQVDLFGGSGVMSEEPMPSLAEVRAALDADDVVTVPRGSGGGAGDPRLATRGGGIVLPESANDRARERVAGRVGQGPVFSAGRVFDLDGEDEEEVLVVGRRG